MPMATGTGSMIFKFVVMLPMLSLLLLFLVATSFVEAFSTPHLAITTASNSGVGAGAATSAMIQLPSIVPRGSSTSLKAWKTATASTLPKIGQDGLFHITNEEEYRSLLEANPDKLIVLKVFSTWCKTCKAMAPRFLTLSRGIGNFHAQTNNERPIIWAEVPHNQDTNGFVRKTLKVKAVPSVLLHAGNGKVVDCFPCGPSKVGPILRPKLVALVTDHIDPATYTLFSHPANTNANANAKPKNTAMAPPNPVVLAKHIQSTLAKQNPLKMLALLCQMLQTRWLQLVKGAHNNKPVEQ